MKKNPLKHALLSLSVDLLAHVFDVLKADLKSDVAKELFLYYQGTTVVLQYLKPVNKVMWECCSNLHLRSAVYKTIFVYINILDSDWLVQLQSSQDCLLPGQYHLQSNQDHLHMVSILCSLVILSSICSTYNWLSLSQSPRVSLKYFAISLPWHIRFAELRKNQTNEFVIWLLKLEIYWKYCGKEEKLLLRSNFSSFPQYFATCC